MNMRKVHEDQEDRKILQEMKKNQARLHNQTATDFSRLIPNSKDSFIKTANTFKK